MKSSTHSIINMLLHWHYVQVTSPLMWRWCLNPWSSPPQRRWPSLIGWPIASPRGRDLHPRSFWVSPFLWVEVFRLCVSCELVNCMQWERQYTDYMQKQTYNKTCRFVTISLRLAYQSESWIESYNSLSYWFSLKESISANRMLLCLTPIELRTITLI